MPPCLPRALRNSELEHSVSCFQKTEAGRQLLTRRKQNSQADIPGPSPAHAPSHHAKILLDFILGISTCISMERLIDPGKCPSEGFLQIELLCFPSGGGLGQPTFIFRFQRMTSPSHLTTPWLGLEMCISVARTVMEGNDSQILLNFLLSALIILECPRTYISEKETSRLDKISPAEGNAC